MAVMFAVHAEISVSSFERNGIVTENYPWKQTSLCRSSFYPRPVLVLDLNVRKMKRIGTYSLRAPNCRKMYAFSKGESAKQLVGGGILENKFDFKPSFDEYLKVMESARTGRENKQRHNSNRYRSKNGIMERERENVKLGKLVEHSHPEKRNLVTEQNENADGGTDEVVFGRSRVNYRESGGRGLKDVRKMDLWKGSSELGCVGKFQGLVQDELEGNESNMDMKMNTTQGGERTKGRRTKYQIGSLVPELKDFKDLSEQERSGQLHAAENTGRRMNVGGELGHERSHVQAKTIIGRKTALNNGNALRSYGNFFEEGDNNDVKMERAAFKNFEDFNDVVDKPRVSRMDMEERIQKLAKRLNGADINMPEWMFSKMMRSAKIRFCDHSILRCIQILGKLGNWRRVLQVIEWLQLRERFKSHRTRYIYTSALDVLGKARRPVESLNVFYAMQQHMSSYPDLVAYHCIAVTLGQAGHMKELFDVIDCMRSLPKKKYKMEILEKWDPRLEPDIVVYNSVMFACGKYNLVHEFFRKMQKSSIPNALNYKVLVNTLWREGKTDEAVLAVQDMQRRGIVGSAALYYDLARCLCSVGRCQEALMQIEKMCGVANKPLVVTYTGLIQASLDSGNIQNGAYIFNEMRKFCHPNLVTFNIMIKAYVGHGMFKEAKELFQKMLDDGNHIRSTFDYKTRVMPDIYSFNTMLDACIAEKRWDEFEFVYRVMLNHGYYFNAKRHLRMILEASRAGKGEPLEITWTHLVQTNQILPPSLIKERFCMKLGKGDYAAAISCITGQTTSASQAFSKTALLKLFKENIQRFQKDSLYCLIHELNTLIDINDLPNPVLLNLFASLTNFLRTNG
ncbi:pentatricopeptide repeat-containing protein At1g30610, chloroplastic isoform X2 [Malania oleifera]|uniref:pentatricopeptide repeat-containing protein At1g30610, chloroplastic isoform X2 n=1 Tax=Malania oleifera TaxID=397392 RepID=UPI0025AE6BA1|nr:pentatricopeptide repeat-containing protein At1g30610, chloroplastic isoform X2 [Malania oleifera]